MRGSFFELNVAVSGIFTAKAGLNIVSHNMANASTIGYSRQYGDIKASNPFAVYNGKGMIGTGSELYGIGQIRDFYLDKKLWNNSAVLGEYSVKRSQLMLTQTIFNALDETGLKAQMDDFFNVLEDLTTHANDSTYRTNFIKQAESLTTYMQSTYESMLKQQRDINTEVKATVETINSLGSQIAALNNQIRIYEYDGSKANDLRDMRATLIDELSVYVNVDVKEELNVDGVKQFTVQLNGQDFISHKNVRYLECVEREASDGLGGDAQLYANPNDIQGLYDIYWKNSSSEFNIYSSTLTGQLKGLIDLRDGNGGHYVKTTSIEVVGTDSIKLKLDENITGNKIREDLNEGGGFIKIKDRVSGVEIEYKYTECDIDYSTDPPTATFKISPDTPLRDSVSTDDTATVGETTSYKGIPYYLDKLNKFARTIAMAMNEGKNLQGEYLDQDNIIGHYDSYDLYGKKSEIYFFTYMYKNASGVSEEVNSGFNVNKLTALNMVVNSKLEDPKLLAMAKYQPNESGESDNIAGLGYLRINSNKSLFMEGNLGDYITQVNGELGIDLRQANRFEENYTDVTAAISYQRMSVSGVSLDEEIANMIRFQQQFTAASRLINVIDGIYNTLINNIGAF